MHNIFDMKKILIIFLLFVLSSCGIQKDKTVFISILARNKGYALPKYLEGIEKLDYNKKLITIYINTNNNKDDTEAILNAWVEKNSKKYRKVIYETHEVEALSPDKTNPHKWNGTRLKVLARIRNRSMELAREQGCEFYFVSDCDNFVTPCTLKTLVNKNKDIIAPLLITIPYHPVSNYWCKIDQDGYYRDDPFYYEILSRKVRGTFSVPLVHCTYLVRTELLPKLTYFDGSDLWEFMIFSKSARDNGIDQYICNEEDFGVQWSDRDVDLTTEKYLFDYFIKHGQRANFIQEEDKMLVELEDSIMMVDPITHEREFISKE